MPDDPPVPPVPNDGTPAEPDDGGGRADAFDAAFDGEAWAAEGRVRRRRTSQPKSSRRRRTERAPERARAPKSSGSGRGRLGRRSGRRRRFPTPVRVAGYVLAGLVGLTVAWVLVTGLLARQQLDQGRTALAGVRAKISAGDIVGATADGRALLLHAHRAEVMTSGPAWAGAAAIPWVGDPLQTVRGLTGQTARLAAQAVPGLLTVAGAVDPDAVVAPDGTVDVAALEQAAPAVHTAADAVRDADVAVAALPTSTWLPFVDSARTSVGADLTRFSGTLTTSDQALQVLPTLLGGDGTTRRYFVAFQNNAELRGTGGLPGAFGILSAADGKVGFEQFQSDGALNGVGSSGLDFGADYDAHYGFNNPYGVYANSNLSPNFPYAAQIWLSMWKNKSGEQLDGALAVDPTALSYLLGVTGPATGPDGAQVSADNVVALLEKDAYAQYAEAGENDQRRQFILDVAEAAERRVLSGSKNPARLLDAFGRAISERRVVAWSADPRIEGVLAQAPVGGVVADTAEPYSLLSINNSSSGKLDYYLKRSVRWERTGCGDTRTVTVTITLTNTAPSSGLPPYVTVRLDDPPYPTVPGQNKSLVDYVATRGAALTDVSQDGTPIGVTPYTDDGHPTFRTIADLAPGASTTFVYTLTEPAGDQPVTIAKQPGVIPIDVTVDDRSCR